MEQKNRLMIVIAITVLILCAMFTSFGRNLFALDPPAVVLPGSDSSAGDPSGGNTPSGSNPYQQVEVTPNTVQNVIRTLSRPDSYYQESTVETFWAGGSSSVPIQAWIDDGWTRIRKVMPSGVIRHDLVGDGTLYYWYDGSNQYETTPADEASADLAQRLPTYETVLELDPTLITTAGYELCDAIPCILVEVSLAEPARLERYWVSVDSGLLICAETEQDGQLTYRMTASGSVTTPCPANASFALPNGSVLHSVS